MKSTTKTTVTVTRTLELTGKDIIGLLNDYHRMDFKEPQPTYRFIPREAVTIVTVRPGRLLGSNDLLEVDSDTPIVVTWTETTEKSE